MSEEKKVKVLIVDDIADTRENVRKLLHFEPDMDVVGGARTGKEAIDMARRLRPNVILMDINMPDMDGITATEMIAKEVPTAQVVMLSVQDDPNYMRRAMMAGARDFLSKPPSAEELIATIRRMGELSWQQEARVVSVPADGVSAPGVRLPFGRHGKIVTVYSPKGGTGCTTVATSTAIALQSEETRVVLVDGNLQFGDVGVFLNLQGKYNFVDLAEAAHELDHELVETILTPHTSGVKVLLAPTSPEHAEVIKAPAVKSCLQYLKREFDYVIVDTGSAVDDKTLSIFDVTDLIVLLTTPDIPSIKSARLFFDLAEVLEFPANKTYFVLNRAENRRGAITARAIGDSIKHAVQSQVPLDQEMFLQAVNQGVPVVMSSKPIPSAHALRDLAAKIAAVFVEQETAETAE